MHKVSAGEISKTINKLPSYAPFSISGLCFMDNDLYVTSNIGLLKFQNDTLANLLKWYDEDDVISGPWYDELNKRLWISHDGLGILLSFDGHSWKRSKFPIPKGGYTRGDVLSGNRMYSTTQQFFQEGAGTYWKWNEPKFSWEEQSTPVNLKKIKHYDIKNAFDSLEFDGQLIQIMPMGINTFCIIRFEPFFSTPIDNNFFTDEIYYFDKEWKHIPDIFGFNFFTKDAIVLNEKESYLLTKENKLIHLASFQMDTVNIIGRCDAISKSSSGKLIASFRNMGIFEYDTYWKKLFPAPYPIENGEFWTYLAEANNKFVLAMSPYEHSKKTKLWISYDKSLKEIQFKK